jgi:hypothetical protein
LNCAYHVIADHRLLISTLIRSGLQKLINTMRNFKQLIMYSLAETNEIWF